MTISLWFVRETELARLYYKIPPERMPTAEDQIWIPKSVIEHTRKYPPDKPGQYPQHDVEVADWFGEKNDL